MKARIAPFSPENLDAIVRLSLEAWVPVFESLRASMDTAVFDAMHPDWRVDQRAAVSNACLSTEMTTRVAWDDDRIVGFAVSRVHSDSVLGEIHMIAVDPAYQRLGVGAELVQDALELLRESGAKIAMVETGGDPGHAPARATYESAGFGLLPVARYFKSLEQAPSQPAD